MILNAMDGSMFYPMFHLHYLLRDLETSNVKNIKLFLSAKKSLYDDGKMQEIFRKSLTSHFTNELNLKRLNEKNSTKYSFNINHSD